MMTSNQKKCALNCIVIQAQLVLIVSSDGKGTTFIVQNSATGGARGATYANATRRQNFELHTYSYKYFLLPSFTY